MKNELQEENIGLLDLVDLKFLQEFQDAFAKSTNVASITVDEKGPITQPSNFSDFCMKYTRGSELGFKRCNKCDIRWGKLAAQKGKPLIYTCHSGLTDFAVPIMLNGKHIGSILGGQVLTRNPNEEHFRSVARELGINEDEYIEALGKVKIISPEQVKAISRLLFLTANSISEIASRNYNLIKKNKRDILVSKTIEVIRSTLNPDKIKKYFVEIAGDYFNADRCLFVDYDIETDKFLNINTEWLKSPEIKSLLGFNGENIFPEFMAKFKEGRKVIIRDLEKTISRRKLEGYKSLENLYKSGVKSDYALPVKHKDKIMGLLIIHFTEKKRALTHDEFDFLKVLRDQVGIALHQHLLYEKERKTAERESALRKIFEAISGSLDDAIIKNTIVNEIGKALKPDRCFLLTYDEVDDCFIIDKYSEYKSSSKEISFINYDSKDPSVKWFRDSFKEKRETAFENAEEFIAKNNLQGTPVEGHIRKYNIKSGYDAAICYADTLMGYIVLQYTSDYKILDKDDLIFLRTIAAQAGIAISQANLYKKMQLQAEREILLRKIIEVVRSSLDINIIKKQITEEVGKTFNADRCYFRYYDKVKGKFLPPNAEYLSPDTQSLSDIEPDQEALKYFADEVKKQKNGFYPVVIDEKFAQNTPIDTYMKSFGVKTDYIISIEDKQEKVSWLVLHYSKEDPQFDNDYKKLLETIAYQVNMALDQAKLYEDMKKNAERESLLRKINETISSTLDVDKTLSFICVEVAKLFNVQRAIIVEFSNPDDFSSYIVRSEYKSSSNIKGIVDIDTSGRAATYWGENLHASEDILIFDDISKSNAPNYFKHSYEAIGVKSAIGALVQKEQKKWGEIILFEYSNQRTWSNDEIILLDTIADQIYISMQQSDLYTKTKQQAERETILRKIIETISSTMDINNILSFICTETAKLLNVQRTIIVEFYNPDNFGEYNIRSEYRARKGVKSIKDVNSYEKSAAYWGKSLYESSDLIFFDNIETSDAPDYFKNLYKSIGVKSAIGVIVRKSQTRWDAILLFEYDNYRQWTNDERNLLTAIANQIYLSINQAELYTNTKTQAEREKAILSNLPFLAWLKDTKGILLAVNESYAKMCNTTIENVLGKTDYDFFPKEQADSYVAEDNEVMRQAKTIYYEDVIVGPNGPTWIETYKTPVFNENGEVVGTTGVSRDITEQKEVERMKNEFISVISHELRTPLTSIRGSLGLISSNALGVLPEKVNGLLNIANNNTIRLINLINDILDLEKIKAGKMTFAYGEYDVMSLVEETIKANEDYARQYDVRYEIKKRLDNAFVNVDKDKFIQVLTNLLSNAAKFSFPNEVVNILVERKKSLISVSVSNKGNGIPEDSYSKIFESFSQVDSSDARKKGGTGLGLSISKSIIQKMGGNIGFTSKVNDFTTFYFDLPEIHKDNEHKAVLICEDNKTTASCIQSMFKNLNYNVDIASCACDAIELLKNNTYDLMTLDLILPDKDGLVLLNELGQNEKTKDLPVLIISVAKPDLEFVKTNYQVIDWLEKSFNMKDLEKTLYRVMNKKQQNKVNILHVENDEDILKLISLTLKDIAKVTSANNLTEAKNILEKSFFDLIILDYVFPDGTSDKLIPAIKSGPNKNATLIIFSSYEECKMLHSYVDDIILKTNVSNEEFKNCIEKFLKQKVKPE